jgi:hypothetical protein
MHGKRVLFAAAAALSAAAITAPIASASPTAIPAFTCASGQFTHVRSTIDWLRIHTAPGVNTPAVGQIRGGSEFCFTSSSDRYADGAYWYQGYGYNGTTKVSGWADGDYLIGP